MSNRVCNSCDFEIAGSACTCTPEHLAARKRVEEMLSRARLVDRQAVSHDMRNPHDERDCQDLLCQYCAFGVEVCANCGGSEDTLTTNCPLEQLSYEMQQRIMRGVIDYQRELWIELGPKAVPYDGE